MPHRNCLSRRRAPERPRQPIGTTWDSGSSTAALAGTDGPRRRFSPQASREVPLGRQSNRLMAGGFLQCGDQASVGHGLWRKLTFTNRPELRSIVTNAYRPGRAINFAKPATPTGKCTCNIKKSAGSTCAIRSAFGVEAHTNG